MGKTTRRVESRASGQKSWPGSKTSNGTRLGSRQEVGIEKALSLDTPAQNKKSRTVKEKPVKEMNAAAEQPSFTDFGLYRCEGCGKMVMGFDREEHAREAHGGRGWREER